MKKIDIITLIISVIALAAAVSFGIISIKNGKAAETPKATAEEREAHAGEIVYVELDRILQEYDMANDLRSVVETKVQNIHIRKWSGGVNGHTKGYTRHCVE